MAGKGEEQTRGRLDISFGEISALLAVAAIGVYIVGLFALFFPISRTFTGDFTTAWYVVSLVPRTMVAGQGVRQVLAYPALSVFVITVIYLSVGFLKKKLRVNPLVAAFVVFVVIAISSLAYLVWVVFTAEPSEPVYSRSNLTEAGISIFGFLVVLVGDFLAGGLIYQGIEFVEGHYLPRLTNSQYLLRGLAVQIVAAFIMASLNAVIKDPPLPKVSLTGASITNGALITHSEGFWYVFDREGTLQAIPDNEAGTVRVASQRQ